MATFYAGNNISSIGIRRFQSSVPRGHELQVILFNQNSYKPFLMLVVHCSSRIRQQDKLTPAVRGFMKELIGFSFQGCKQLCFGPHPKCGAAKPEVI
jgi:hypothetical protein